MSNKIIIEGRNFVYRISKNDEAIYEGYIDNLEIVESILSALGYEVEINDDSDLLDINQEFQDIDSGFSIYEVPDDSDFDFNEDDK